MIQKLPRKPQPRLRTDLPPARTAAAADLAVEPKDLLDAVDALADLRAALKVPLHSEEAEARAFEVVDVAAVCVVPNLQQPLEADADLAREAGVKADELNDAAERVQWMTEIHHSFANAEDRVDTSQRLIAKVQRDVQTQIDVACQGLLQDPNLSPDRRSELQAELRLIQTQRAAVATDRKTQADKTAAERARADATLEDERRREEALRTVTRLRRGEAASAEEILAAVDQLQPRRSGAAADDRRDDAR